MNYLSYFNHSLFTPETYYRHYENDLGKGGIDFSNPPEEGDLADLIKRAALSALPFLALYRPAGFALSMGMGSCRVVSHLSAAFSNQQNEQWGQAGSQMFLCSLAVLSVASSVFSFGMGLFVTTFVDTAQGLLRATEHLGKGDLPQGIEELLQTVASGLYLGFMATGALEIILLSTAVQGIISLYQSRSEIKKGHYIEAGAKILLAGVRAVQVSQYQAMIDKRNFLFALKKYQALVERAQRGREVRYLIEHDLVHLNEKIDENQVILSNQEHDYDFGSHFHGYGKGVVKGGNLAFRNVVIDGKEMIELEFKVNHVAREQLEKTLDDLSYLKGKEVQELLRLTGSHATALSVDKTGSLVNFFTEGGESLNWRVQLEGLGSVSVGAKGSILGEGPFSVPNLHDKVVVRMESNKTLYDFHELMAFLDLDIALSVSTSEDLERLKLGHLFRTFFPAEALSLERSDAFFSLGVSDLKAWMIREAPQMEEIYSTYFDKMAPVEILPGRVRYRIEGLASEVRALGISCLTTAVTGPQDDESLFARVDSILSMGMISTELKDHYHVNAEGLSKIRDYSSGGADNVYFQLMPEDFATGKRSLDDFSWYQSRVRLQVPLEALETGTYQYLSCGTGNRDVVDSSMYRPGARYPDRLNILEFAKTLADSQGSDWCQFRAHEVMVKERFAEFEGMLIEDEATKQGLLAYFRSRGRIKKELDGLETIFNIPVDEFMKVRPCV